MKNNLFRNFTALLLSGTMLAGVGCKDYDDDIDNLQKEIDGLKGEIALKADASALKSLQEKIDGIDFSKFLTAADLTGYVTEDKLGTELADLLKSNDFNSKVEEIVKAQGYKTQAEIEAIVSQMMLDKEDVAAIFQEQMAAGETWQSLLPKVQEAITTELGKLDFDAAFDEAFADKELTEAQVQQVTTAVLAALGEQMDEEKVSEIVAGILGDDLGTYLMNYFVENQEMLIGAMTEVMAAQVKEEGNALRNNILALIQENTPEVPNLGAENVTYLQANKLSEVFAAYDAKISEIWSAIDDLSGRIQSIVFVPTAMNQEYDVNLGGYYIAENDDDDVRINLAASPKVKIAFRVAPAALAQPLAEKIAAGTVTAKFIPEKITRANEEPLTYENVTWDDGKIIFTAVADEAIYGALKQNEAYAVALSLSQENTMGNEEAENQTYGFEITSPYFTTNGQSTNVRDNFVLARLDDEGEPVSAYDPAKGVAYDLVWNDMNTVITLLDQYGLAYKEGDKLLSMKKAAEAYLWDADVAEELAFVASHTNIEYTTGYKTQKQLVVTPADPTAKGNETKTVTVKNSSEASIAEVGNALKLTDKASISNGSAKIAMAQEEVYSTVTILGDLLKTMNVNLDFKWSYSKYTAGTYQAEITIPASDRINWEKFNQLPAQFTVTLPLPQESEIVTNGSDIELAFSRKEMLNEESAQQFVVTMENYLTGDGTIAYEEDIHLLDEDGINEIETFVKFKGEVTFDGLPAMTYNVSNEGASVDADYKVTLSTNLNKQLYAQVGSYFADENEVAEFISALTLDYSKVAQTAKLDATPIVLGVTAEISQGKTLTIAFDSEGIDWQKQPSYAYNVPNKGYIAGTNSNSKVVFTLNMTGAYTLTNTIYTLQPNPSYLKTDGNTQYMDLNGSISGDKFTLTQISLGNAYLVSEEATKAGAQLSFRLGIEKEDLPGYGENTLPEITGTLMSWNNCILNTVPVVAELKNSKGELLDSKEFEVRVDVPIKFDAWKTFFNGAKVEVSSSKEGTLNLINSVLALTSDGKTPSTTNPAVAIDMFGSSLFAQNESKDYALTGLAAATTGYGVKIAFDEEVAWTDIENEGMISGVTIDPETGVLTVPMTNEVLAHDVTATVKVTFTYNYDWEPIEKAGVVTGYQKKAHVFEIPVTFTAAN